MKAIISNFRDKSKSAFVNLKTKAASLKPVHSYKHSPLIRRIVSYVLIAVILLVAISELILGIMVYGLKSETRFIQVASRYVPMPVVFTSHGVVTAAAYFEEKNYITHFYASTGQQEVNNTDLSKQILSQLAENNIIADEAIKYKVAISEKDVNDAYQQIADQNGGDVAVVKVLNDLYGLSVKQFKSLIRAQLLRDKFNKDIIKRVTVRHILVRLDQNATQPQIDEAKAKIDGYSKEIAAGVSFADEAKKNSEDVGSNENGGLLDPFARGDMVKEFEDVAFSQPVGVISDPFKTSFGWHILVVENRTGIIDQSFDGWLSDLKSKSIIINLLSV